jgi:hypothetical protein
MVPARAVVVRLGAASACAATAGGAGAATSANSHGQALGDSRLPSTLARIHAVVDGEVVADEVGRLGCLFARQGLRRVCAVARVLAVVHSHSAYPALPRVARVELGFRPAAAVAQACFRGCSSVLQKFDFPLEL